MSLLFQTRRVGDVTVVSCRGRIIAGEEQGGEAVSLERHLEALLRANRLVVLHLGDVDFIDSAGFGMLVRCATRAHSAAGELRICAVSPSVDHILNVTRLKPVLQPYDSEEEAIAEAYRTRRDPASGTADVLCVDESEDILAYLRELLRENGHRAMTASNVRDARILLAAIQPRVVVVGASVRATMVAGTHSTDEFKRLTATCAVINLPPGFPRQEAGASAEQVLAAVRDANSTTF
jgi:anti-sigma B factor antagonist